MRLERILVADDHPLVRSGIVALLSSAMPNCSCTQACSLAEVMAILGEAANFDLITLDLDLPDAKQLDALSALRRCYPQIPIAILSGSRDPNLARAALAAGASGFVSKMHKPETLLAALKAIREHGSYREPALVAPDSEEGHVLDGVASLTPQQRAVFQLVAEGRPNKQIAHVLNISVTTVKAHVSAILAKLGVTSRTQAVILAKRYGLFV